MILDDTVFILGAGSCIPYGFPSGKELSENICSDDYYSFIEDNYSKYKIDKKSITYFRKAFNGLDISIDRFLSMNKSNDEYVKIGKLGIIKYILEGEIKSIHLKPTKLKNELYAYLMNRMTTGLEYETGYKDLLLKNNIHFITFNYDRSLETFLFSEFRKYFDYNLGGWSYTNEAIKYFKFDFIHIYGKIAPLEWQQKDNVLQYAPDIDKINLYTYLYNIKIIYDERNEHMLEHIKKAKDLISNTKNLFFLGFGYDDMNLKLLGFPNIIKNKNINIYGTAINLLDGELSRIKRKITYPKEHMSIDYFYKHYIKLHNKKTNDCRWLLRQYLK